jgi:hypothetical protein
MERLSVRPVSRNRKTRIMGSPRLLDGDLRTLAPLIRIGVTVL